MRPRGWQAMIAVSLIGALSVGGCMGAAIGQYTVTGMLPFATGMSSSMAGRDDPSGYALEDDQPPVAPATGWAED